MSIVGKLIFGQTPGRIAVTDRFRNPGVILQSPDQSGLPVAVLGRKRRALLVIECGPVPILPVIHADVVR